MSLYSPSPRSAARPICIRLGLPALLTASILGCAAPARDRSTRENLRDTLRLPGNAAERQAVEASLDRLMESPLGRALARELARLAARVEIAFVPFGGSHIEVYQGRKELRGVPASVHFEAEHAFVRLNRLYLEADPGWARDQMTAMLAHELLGHTLEALKARGAGVAEAYDHLVENEIHASAVGRMICFELGDTTSEPDGELFSHDLPAYWRAMQLQLPAYAVMLYLPEFADPLPALEQRRRLGIRHLERIDRAAAAIGAARSFVRHSLSRHSGRTLAGLVVDKTAFRWLEGDIVRRLDRAALERRQNVAIRQTIDLRFAHYRSTEGRAALARQQESIRSARGKTFLEEHSRRLAALLRGLADDTRPAPSQVAPPQPPPGQVSWKELKLMYEDDARAEPQGSIGDFNPSLTADWTGALSTDLNGDRERFEHPARR